MDAEPDPPEIPPGKIEIIAGGERRLVPSDLATPENDSRREGGALPIRGAHVGDPPVRFEIDRHSVTAPARARLREDLSALIRVFREAFEIPVSGALEAELQVLNSLEDRGPGAPPPLRREYEHPTPSAPRFRRERERALVARALHATSHALVAHASGAEPLWLGEGLAVAFEGIEVRRDHVVLGLTELRRKRLARARAEDDLADARALLELDAETFDALTPDQAAAVQDQLGSLTLLLLSERESGLRQSMRELLLGERHLEVTEADLTELTRDWRDWLRSDMRISILEEAPPEPEPRPRRRRLRGLRCVPGTIMGPMGPRPTLFCTRRFRIERSPY